MSDCKHKATIKNVETGREYCQDCHKVIINKEFIKKFGPCSDGWKNYLTLHEKFEGTLLEFLHLDGVPSSDKLWLFTQSIPEIERQQRIFAVLCMDRCQTEVSEINDLQLLVMLHWESIDYIGDIEHMKDEEDRAADRAAYWAADRAAYWAADRAAYWAAYRAADRAADRAAYWAAYRAADRAAEKDVQLEIAKYVLTEML